jgi:hypothetical protein
LRSDVLYKTVIRDMRKYFLVHFNATTKYVKKKRNKKTNFLLNQVKTFLSEIVWPGLHIPNSSANFFNLNDLGMVLGSIFYPKSIDVLLTSNGGEVDISKIQEYKKIHSYLYEFTQKRLLYLIDLPQFAMLYC